jgi:hypothetical protein
MGGVAQQESGNTNYQCPCPTGANALGTADADTAQISFILELCRLARKCGSLTHRSHFGSRYKLGCCGHASRFGFGLKPTGSVRTLPAHTQAIFATPWTLARPRLWDRSPTGSLPSDHIHIHVGPASSSPPIHMPTVFLPESGMPSESMGFLSSVGSSVRLLTSRSGVRASQGAFCLLNLSFGTLCATIQIVTMRCIDLHPFWQVYVRMPLGFRSISKRKRSFCKRCRGISLDFCGLASSLGLHRLP